MPTARRLRNQALPAYHTYVDSGCYVHPACLSCPLPSCVFESGQSRWAVSHRARLNRFADLLRGGTPLLDAAIIMKISPRNAYRWQAALTAPR